MGKNGLLICFLLKSVLAFMTEPIYAMTFFNVIAVKHKATALCQGTLKQSCGLFKGKERSDAVRAFGAQRRKGLALARQGRRLCRPRVACQPPLCPFLFPALRP